MNKSDRLPEGWARADVNDTGDFINGLAFKPVDWEGSGRPIIRIQNLTDKSKAFNRTSREYSPDYIVQFGDILVSWSASLDAFIWDREEGVLNQHIFKVQPEYRLVDKGFLFPLLRNAIREMIQSEHLHGSTMKHINRGPFLAHPVLLPPLNEQRRIGSKIEALQARSDAAKQALDAIPPLLEKLRQSVLAAAFRGDLTKAWREAHPDVEPASKLLERIRAERRRRWEEANPRKKYVEPERVDAEGLPELPESWCWASLDEMAQGFDYGTATKSDNDGRVPVLRMGNLQGGEIDWTDLKYTSDEEEIVKYALVNNTVLFNRTNSPELVGKTAIYRGDRAAIFAGYLIRIVLQSDMSADFVNLNLNSIWGRDWCWRVKSDGVSQSNISAGKLRTYPIPVCPKFEQDQLVVAVRAQFELVKRLSTVITEMSERGEHLTQSILAKAFRGELVPQDPSDEPASVLLERIRAERSAAPSTRKPRSPKKPGARKK